MTETAFITDIQEVFDDAVQIRNEIGAILDEIYIVTRTWSGDQPGNGTAIESKVIIFPAPWIIDLSQDLRLKEGGVIHQGDILLKQISRKRYPLETDINCTSTNPKIEKFIELGGYLYQVISVKKTYADWNIQIRRLTDQTRY